MDATETLVVVWAWCVPALLQGTLLLGLVWLADRCLARRVWSEVLSAAWLLALARCFLPPQLGSPWSVTEPLGAPTLAAAQRTPAVGALVAGVVIHLAVVVALLVLRARRRARLAAHIVDVAPTRAWSAALERAALQLGVRRVPRFGVLAGLAAPAVSGILRPVLLVPRAWLTRAPTRRDEHALLHELAHLARRDPWLDELCAVLRALLWFHPLAWVAVRRVRELAELQCDQLVVRVLGAEAPDYRDTLVLAARRLVTRATGTPPLVAELRGFLGRHSAILERLERLERGAPRSRGLVHTVCAAFVLVCATCVLPMSPRAFGSEALRAQARAVFESQRDGLNPSCFQLQAAALVLAANSAN